MTCLLRGMTLLLVTSTVVACAAARDVEDSAASAAGGAGVGGGSLDGVGGDQSGTCSPDLQSIEDAEGNVIAVCPSDQGCYAGACIPACDAAEKSRGSIGCEFWAAVPPFNDNANPHGGGPCYAVFVANTWGRSAKITVERSGTSFDATQFGRIPKGVGPSTTYDPLPVDGLPPGEVAVLFLSQRPEAAFACPVPPALLDDAEIHGSGVGQAFRVRVDTPVTVYDIVPYGGAKSYLPSASLLFPATAWGTNYAAVAPHPDGSGALWVSIVGAVDGTHVSVLPSVTLPGGPDLADAVGGQPSEYALDAGQVLQWIGTDPAGTIFESDQPIGLFTGNTLLRVATATSPEGGGKDSAHQQLTPVKALGSEYVGGGIATRLASLEPESVPYRLLGVVDGTELSWEPSVPAGAPQKLDAGTVAQFDTTTRFVVRSQDDEHPFAITQYMPGGNLVGSRPGCTAGSGPCALGDEEWVTLVPPAQFLRRYVFMADPSYGTTNLIVTRIRGQDGFADVDLDCLGAVTGWEAVGSSSMYESATLELVFAGLPQGQCTSSRLEATSSGRFGIVVWGTDYYASYGYPAGGNLAAINDVVVPVPK